MNVVPEQLDWSAARIACSATAVFDALSTQAAADVASRQAGRTQAEIRDGFAFAFIRDDGQDRYFSVVCDRKQQNVRVLLQDGVIHVSRDTGITHDWSFVVTPVLDAAGQCRLSIDHAGEFTVWQVTRRALEDTFFTPPPAR